MIFHDESEDAQEKIMGEINMTPLIDIMLVLLIIFMVTSSISLESGIDVTLPEAQTPTKFSKDNENGIIITLNQAGTIFIQGKETKSEELEPALAKALQEANTELVIFEGDKQATLGKTIELIDLAKKLGAKKFAIATNEK